MFTLKHVVGFFILQITVSLFCLAYPDNSESAATEELWDYYEDDLEKICPEKDQSLISHSDVKYLIEDKANTLKIKENFVNSYYPAAEEILKKYMGELEELQKSIDDRPEHMRHILLDMARLRQKLEPHVEEIATRLEKIYTIEDNINDVVKDSAIKLNQLEKYKNMCKINCEEISIENRFGHKIDNNPFIVSQSAGRYCGRIKDLNDNINKKLSEVQVQYDEDLNQQLEIRNTKYPQIITEFKINLKEAAVKHFGMTMYDILSLQDDYHHFDQKLKDVNISSEIFNILENKAEIGFRIIGLQRDLEKYRHYCMKCNMNQRVKRNVLHLLDEKVDGVDESFEPIKETTDSQINDVIDELIKTIITEIKENIKNNFTSIFEELDKKVNDPDIIDNFIAKLHPIQSEIEDDIKMEQEALRGLSSRIPEALIDNIIALSKESKQIIQNLESAKQFIDQFINKNSV